MEPNKRIRLDPVQKHVDETEEINTPFQIDSGIKISEIAGRKTLILSETVDKALQKKNLDAISM